MGEISISKIIIVEIISGIVVPIITLYIGYKININYTEKMESKRKKEEDEKLSIEEVKATKKSVETFNRNVIGQYIDFLNNGKAYNELVKSARKGATMTNFIDVRPLFEDEKVYMKSQRWDCDYNSIKLFYDTKVYGQYNGPDYVFAEEYLSIIKELKLDEEMNKRRIEKI